MTVCWMRSEAAFWSLKSSWEVSRVWELKMRVVDQGAGGAAGPDVRRGQRVRGEFSEVGRRWKGLRGMFYEDFSFLALGESAW